MPTYSMLPCIADRTYSNFFYRYDWLCHLALLKLSLQIINYMLHDSMSCWNIQSHILCTQTYIRGRRLSCCPNPVNRKKGNRDSDPQAELLHAHIGNVLEKSVATIASNSVVIDDIIEIPMTSNPANRKKGNRDSNP